MRTLLLSGATALAFLSAAGPARAQALVHDPVHMAEAVMQWKAHFDAMRA